MNYEKKLALAKEALDSGSYDKETIEYLFPELKEREDDRKPNGGIVFEDFNEGDGFYKVNLAYLSKEQVGEIENIVKKWNTELKEIDDEMMRKEILIYLDWLDGRKEYAPKGEYTIRDMIAWLERQGEQKPTDITDKLKEEYQKSWDDAMQQLPKEVDSQIWHIASCCKFAKLKDELFEQCSLKELIDD